MNHQELKHRLRTDARRLPLADDRSLQRRIVAALGHHTRPAPANPDASLYRPWHRRMVLAMCVPAVTALLLLLFSIPSPTPVRTAPQQQPVADTAHSVPTLAQVELQLRQQLANSEQSLLQELQRVDQDWQKTRRVIGLSRAMK